MTPARELGQSMWQQKDRQTLGHTPPHRCRGPWDSDVGPGEVTGVLLDETLNRVWDVRVLPGTRARAGGRLQRARPAVFEALLATHSCGYSVLLPSHESNCR